ncbi:MAG: YbhB/YbcL family Raf kinase inhibitor-like protein [Chlamydiales bacterium]|nr:YbhB/YbcL family Raf kinase inhibitor-like protein [Chlamydiales bacterium]
MHLSSAAFTHQGKIPSKYTCEGENINPPLSIKDVPSQAKSLVLIMDDPDVPEFVRKDRMWVHWVAFDMPPTLKEIKENSPAPGISGKNTGGKLGYQGPCPPDRQHRYFFKLYALDSLLSLPQGSTKQQVEKAMEGHILSSVELIGTYNKAANC